jgi:hypothetical protein
LTVAAHTRCTASGLIGVSSAPYEIFSYSFAIEHQGDTLVNANMDTIAAAVQAFHARPTSKIATNAILREVRFAHVNALGVQDQPTYLKAVDTRGGGGSPLYPSQVALAVSLRGPVRVSPARGRFYLPMPTAFVNESSGLMDAAVASGVADSAVTLANAISALGATTRMSIDSRYGMATVTEIRVGRVLDTLRTRRNAVKEAYAAATLALA